MNDVIYSAYMGGGQRDLKVRKKCLCHLWMAPDVLRREAGHNPLDQVSPDIVPRQHPRTKALRQKSLRQNPQSNYSRDNSLRTYLPDDMPRTTSPPRRKTQLPRTNR